MTLSHRNRILKAAFSIASVFLIVFAAASFEAVSACTQAAAEAARRTSGLSRLFGQFLTVSPYAVYLSIAAAILYSFITVILIYYFFEKTQSPEILFIALFAFSFTFEVMRIMAPLRLKYEISYLYVILSSRFLLFGRYFGIFSLFAASVYAAGLSPQRQKIGLLVVFSATMVIALGVPVDVLSWDTSFNTITGYTAMFRTLEIGITLITVTGFFISSWSRGEKEFIHIGIGSILVLTGRSLLLSTDTWISPLPAVVLLGIGITLIGKKLHKVYLWL